MSFPEHYYLGTIVRLYGFKGEVYIKLDVDHPEEYLEMESVFIEINQKLVPFFIEESQFGSKGLLRVKFEDVNTEKDAKQLLRKDLYLPLDVLEEAEEGDFYFHEIIGFEVVDEHSGPVGTITEVLEYPGNPIMKIEYREDDILIPLQDAFLVSVNKQERIIRVDLPEGMLDLNA